MRKPFATLRFALAFGHYCANLHYTNGSAYRGVIWQGEYMPDRSFEAWKSWKQAQQKFDYYIVALSSAFFAYLGASFKVEHSLNWAYCLELLSLASIMVSIFFGILRIQSDLSIQSIDYRKAYANEHLDLTNKVVMSNGRAIDGATGNFIPVEDAKKRQIDLAKFIESADKYLKNLGNSSERFFNIRNITLLLGFLLLLASKATELWNYQTTI